MSEHERMERLSSLADAAVGAARLMISAHPDDADAYAEQVLKSFVALVQPALIKGAGLHEREETDLDILTDMTVDAFYGVAGAVWEGSAEERSRVLSIFAGLAPCWLDMMLIAAGDDTEGAREMRAELGGMGLDGCLGAMLDGLRRSPEAKKALERNTALGDEARAAIGRALSCPCSHR